eukprot:scaffold3006_cov111-Isochrysis_galbana.AAC.2
MEAPKGWSPRTAACEPDAEWCALLHAGVAFFRRGARDANVSCLAMAHASSPVALQLDRHLCVRRGLRCMDRSAPAARQFLLAILVGFACRKGNWNRHSFDEELRQLAAVV